MARPRPYRIAFLQTVMLGNKNRYRVLRSIVETDDSVRAYWYPVRSWVIDDWLSGLPPWLRVRVRQLLDSIRLFLPIRLDAVVVHCPEIWGLYGAFHSLFRPGCVLVANTDALPRPSGRIATRLHQRADARADLFLLWTSTVADQLSATSPNTRGRIQVIAPGIQTDHWPVRDVDNYPSHPHFRVLFVGGEPARKGLDTLIDAFDQLDDSFELHVVTQSRNLPENLGKRLIDDPRCTVYLDIQPDSLDLKSLYRSADIFALPTRYEPYGFVFVEALASGVPVIAANVGGVSDIVVDGVTGRLVAPDDPAALAEAIRSVQRLAPPERRALADAGRIHAVEHHDARTNAVELLRLVKEAIHSRASCGPGLSRRRRAHSVRSACFNLYPRPAPARRDHSHRCSSA
jgi:glycosyltransferase involved in cell wall biosynthesis